jgi:hypothetical protein
MSLPSSSSASGSDFTSMVSRSAIISTSARIFGCASVRMRPRWKYDDTRFFRLLALPT